MSDILTVGNCHVDEWAEFWSSHGWRYDGEENVYAKQVKGRSELMRVELNVYGNYQSASSWLRTMEGVMADWIAPTPLQQIADELDELANTKIMGGWA